MLADRLDEPGLILTALGPPPCRKKDSWSDMTFESVESVFGNQDQMYVDQRTVCTKCCYWTGAMAECLAVVA